MENFEPNFTEEVVETVEPVAEEKSSVMGLISMILGIVSIVSCCSGTPFGIAAIILSCIEKSKLGEASKKGKLGLILGIIGAAIGLLASIIVGVLYGIGGAAASY